MNVIKAVILDDEMHGREVIRHLFTKNFPEIEVEAMCQNMEQLVETFTVLHPRILFMDIRIGEDKSFDVFSRINLANTAIIFVTGYSEYALEAFKSNAVDYLLKPVKEAELVLAVGKALTRLQTDLQKATICIRGVQSYELLEIQDIVYAESQSNYTVFHMDDGRKIVTSKTLKVFDRILESNGFSRVHRSYHVNMSKIKEYQVSNRVLVLTGGGKVEVSKTKHEEMLALFKRNRAY